MLPIITGTFEELVLSDGACEVAEDGAVTERLEESPTGVPTAELVLDTDRVTVTGIVTTLVLPLLPVAVIVSDVIVGPSEFGGVKMVTEVVNDVLVAWLTVVGAVTVEIPRGPGVTIVNGSV